MVDVKKLIVKPISPKDGNAFVAANHYSGKVVPNSQLHFGVFCNGILAGCLQFGPSMIKKNIIGLVADTGWNEFIELNRMAFVDWLPKNSESRVIGYCLRAIKKQYPHIKWVITFADATQCGDGTIYRATGAILTGIKTNVGLRKNLKTGEVLQQIAAHHRKIAKEFRSSPEWVPIPGYQIRYIWLLKQGLKLTVPALSYDDIKKAGAGMYKGQLRAGSSDNAASGFQSEEGGAIPTPALHSTKIV